MISSLMCIKSIRAKFSEIQWLAHLIRLLMISYLDFPFFPEISGITTRCRWILVSRQTAPHQINVGICNYQTYRINGQLISDSHLGFTK